MANIISAKKRARQDVKRTQQNRLHLVRMRTAIRKTKEETTTEGARKLLSVAQSYIARTAKRNIISKKTAQRLTARLAAHIKPQK